MRWETPGGNARPGCKGGGPVGLFHEPIHATHLYFFGYFVGHHLPMVVYSVLVEFLEDICSVVGVEFQNRLMFCVFGVSSDLPVESRLKISDQGKTLGKFTEQYVCVWVLDGLQEVMEEGYLCDHLRLLVCSLAVVW